MLAMVVGAVAPRDDLTAVVRRIAPVELLAKRELRKTERASIVAEMWRITKEKWTGMDDGRNEDEAGWLTVEAVLGQIRAMRNPML